MKWFFGFAFIAGAAVVVFWTILIVYAVVTHRGAGQVLLLVFSLFALMYFSREMYRSYRKPESDD